MRFALEREREEHAARGGRRGAAAHRPRAARRRRTRDERHRRPVRRGHHVIDTKPEEARARAGGHREDQPGALVEMRRLLGVLRDRAMTAATSRPTPGLARPARRWWSTSRAGGVTSTLAVTGDLAALPPGVDLSAYRIVQEALTNVHQARRRRRATVTVGCRPTARHHRGHDAGAGPAPAAPSDEWHVEPGTGSSACASGSPCSAGSSRRARVPGGGFRVMADCRPGEARP